MKWTEKYTIYNLIKLKKSLFTVIFPVGQIYTKTMSFSFRFRFQSERKHTPLKLNAFCLYNLFTSVHFKTGHGH